MSNFFSAATLSRLLAAGRIAVTLPLPSPQRPPLQLTWYPPRTTPAEKVDNQTILPPIICIPPPPSPPPSPVPETHFSPTLKPAPLSPTRTPEKKDDPPQSPDSFYQLMNEALAVMSKRRKGKAPINEDVLEVSSAATPKPKRKRTKEVSLHSSSPPPKKSTDPRRSARRILSSPTVGVVDMYERSLVKEVMFTDEWLQQRGWVNSNRC